MEARIERDELREEHDEARQTLRGYMNPKVRSPLRQTLRTLLRNWQWRVERQLRLEEIGPSPLGVVGPAGPTPARPLGLRDLWLGAQRRRPGLHPYKRRHRPQGGQWPKESTSLLLRQEAPWPEMPGQKQMPMIGILGVTRRPKAAGELWAEGRARPANPSRCLLLLRRVRL